MLLTCFCHIIAYIYLSVSASSQLPFQIQPQHARRKSCLSYAAVFTEQWPCGYSVDRLAFLTRSNSRPFPLFLPSLCSSFNERVAQWRRQRIFFSFLFFFVLSAFEARFIRKVSFQPFFFSTSRKVSHRIA